ncbi:hypothetical protein NPIL_320101, partial [Nephila pilipes]
NTVSIITCDRYQNFAPQMLKCHVFEEGITSFNFPDVFCELDILPLTSESRSRQGGALNMKGWRRQWCQHYSRLPGWFRRKNFRWSPCL